MSRLALLVLCALLSASGCGDSCAKACDKLFDCAESSPVTGAACPAMVLPNTTRENCPDRCRGQANANAWAECVNKSNACPSSDPFAWCTLLTECRDAGQP